MKKIERCYNCGKELLDGQATREHIPAKALFDGRDSKYTKNRITVPACFECNNKYSKTDEEFRNMIGIISNHNENDIITEKSVRSILRKPSGTSRLRIDSLGKVFGVKFDGNIFEDSNIKNFKGVFYHQYGSPLPNNYEILVIIDVDNHRESTLCAIEYLKNNFVWKCSGHKDIFSYCIQPLRDIENRYSMEDFMFDENDKIIVCGMVYNKEHGALVYARKIESMIPEEDL